MFHRHWIVRRIARFMFHRHRIVRRIARVVFHRHWIDRRIARFVFHRHRIDRRIARFVFHRHWIVRRIARFVFHRHWIDRRIAKRPKSRYTLNKLINCTFSAFSYEPLRKKSRISFHCNDDTDSSPAIFFYQLMSSILSPWMPMIRYDNPIKHNAFLFSIHSLEFIQSSFRDLLSPYTLPPPPSQPLTQIYRYRLYNDI